MGVELQDHHALVARPEVLRRACSPCKRPTPFGVPQGVPPMCHRFSTERRSRITFFSGASLRADGTGSEALGFRRRRPLGRVRTTEDRRSWRLNSAAAVLLILGLLLALAVVGHDAADLNEGVYPLHHTPHNFLGLPGRDGGAPRRRCLAMHRLCLSGRLACAGAAVVSAPGLAPFGLAFAWLAAFDAVRRGARRPPRSGLAGRPAGRSGRGARRLVVPLAGGRISIHEYSSSCSEYAC